MFPPKSFDLLFTDPPYAVNYEGGHNDKKRDKLIGDDSTDLYKQFLPLAERIVNGPCYLWFAGANGRDVYDAVEDAGFEIANMLIWNKNSIAGAINSCYIPKHEPCLFFKPKGSTLRWCGPTNECSVWDVKREHVNDLHPTQKPVALAHRAIKNHDVKTIIDPFAGSGSTGVAALQLKRRCILIELERKYCDVIVKRLEGTINSISYRLLS